MPGCSSPGETVVNNGHKSCLHEAYLLEGGDEQNKQNK